METTIKRRYPIWLSSTALVKLWGLAAGVCIGFGYSVAVYAQARVVDSIDALTPDPLQPFVSVSTRWVTASLTAIVGTCVAGLVYMVVWAHRRRHGWAGYEGHRVMVGGITCWIATGAVTLGWRLWGWETNGDLVAGLAATPPRVLLLGMGPVVYGFLFYRAAKHKLPARVERLSEQRERGQQEGAA